MSLILLMLALAQDLPLAPTAVPDAELATQRGGFALPNGIDVALTVQTQTSINGAIVLRTEFRADQGPATLTTYVPKPGEPVPAQSIGNAVSTGATGPVVSYDPRTGIQVTPGNGSPTVMIVGAGSGQAVPAGLVELAGGAGATANGVVSQSSRNGLSSVALEAADLTITHLAGAAFGSAIANMGSDRAIDTQTAVSIDLRNAGPDVLGSAMMRVENVALEALMSRP